MHIHTHTRCLIVLFYTKGLDFGPEALYTNSSVNLRIRRTQGRGRGGSWIVGERCVWTISLSFSLLSLSLSSFFSSCCLCKVLMQDYNFHIINIYTNNGISDDLRNYLYSYNKTRQNFSRIRVVRYYKVKHF